MRALLLALFALLLLATTARAYDGELPAFPTKFAHGYAFVRCPERPGFPVKCVLHSTKPTPTQGPQFVGICAYKDEDLLPNAVLRYMPVCQTSWCEDLVVNGVTYAPACMAQTWHYNPSRRSFGPCDASCHYPGYSTE